MYFYVGENALKELNENHKTRILDENGEDTGGKLCISLIGEPYINDLFGADEAIFLDVLELEDDCFSCRVTTNDKPQFFTFYIFKPSKVGLKTKWTKD